MASVLGKIAKTGKEKFTHRDSKLNFVIPENVASYRGINGKKDDRNLMVGEDNFRFQIGKMDKKNETIYSKEIILGGVEYLCKKVGNDQKIIIQLRPDLSRYLCNRDQKKKNDDVLTFQQEEEKIEKLIKKYFKRRAERIQIVNISDTYPEIFNLLRQNGRKGLEIDNPVVRAENISALSIAQYLYQVSQKNKKFMEMLYNTKSDKQKQEDTKPIGENESDYYALVEVAIRLYEILKGINIQGGIDRQTKYDKIIGGILYGKDINTFKTKNYPDILALHNVCNQIAPQVEFEKIYVSTKEIKAIENKKTEKNILMKKVVSYTSIALATVLSLTAGYEISEYNQKKQAEKISEALLDKSLSGKYSQKAEFDLIERMAPGEKSGLVRKINESTETMYNDFIKIYGSGKGNEGVLDILKKLMKQYFLQSDTTGKLVNIDKVYDPFLVPDKLHKTLKEFVSTYSEFLGEYGFTTIPYPQMITYKEACKYTTQLPGNVVVNYSEGNPGGPILNIESDSTVYQKEFDLFLAKAKEKGFASIQKLPVHSFVSKRYGYFLHSNGTQYDVLMVQGNDEKQFLLACEWEAGEQYFQETQTHVYTKHNGEIVAKDFLDNRMVK